MKEVGDAILADDIPHDWPISYLLECLNPGPSSVLAM